MQVHQTVLAHRLELDSSGTLEGSSLLRVPNDPSAVEGASDTHQVVTETTVVVSSTSIDVGRAASAGAAGVQSEGENDGSQSSRSRRDFQLV